MRALIAVLAVATIFTFANASGQIIDADLTMDKETVEVLLKAVQFVNTKHPNFHASLTAVPQLLKKTTQVVAGIKTTFTFKLPPRDGHAYLYYAEVWDAPWMGANNQVIKACVMDLGKSLHACASGNECLTLVTEKGTCSTDDN